MAFYLRANSKTNKERYLTHIVRTGIDLLSSPLPHGRDFYPVTSNREEINAIDE